MKFSKKYSFLLFFLALATGVILGTFLNFPVPEPKDATYLNKNKLHKLISFIENEYVDSINTDSIVDLACNNILEKLDPHSVYIPKEDYNELAESMQGDFVGIGVNFYMFKDTLAVISPIKNGPADQAGIIAGDRILFAGKSKLHGRKLPTDSLFNKLKGEVGSKLQLTILRKTDKKLLKFNVIRNRVSIKSVDVGLMLNQNTSYVKINRFAATTYREFISELQSLKKQGAQTLILDLRDNGGGYMEEASAIADEFLTKDKLIVFTKNKKGRIDKSFATEKGIFEKGKIIVLINENSASASEIIAGAIQDNDRGTIIGRRSFGKGLVQREMDFQDGSAVRLTIARYFTPTGRSIQKSYKKGTEQYYKDFEKRFDNGELYLKDSVKINDTLKFKTPKGKLVYGGGGIVPDIFVPIASNKNLAEMQYLIQSGTMGFFVFEQLDKNRTNFKAKSIQTVTEMLSKTDKYFTNYQKYILQNTDYKITENQKKLVKTYINAEFIKQLFDEKSYYEIILQQDVMVQKALNLK